MPATKPHIPAGVWVLGFVSLLMDVASEMVHSLLPLFLVGSLGASALAVGWIEGLARASAHIVKVFSGVLSDWYGRRKTLALIGYGLGALSKPLFALAPSTGWVLGARLLDRFGKGIRGAPRDALVADITPPEIRGAAYGLRQSLDAVGAYLGPLCAVGLMLLWSNDIRAVFWVAVIPATLSVLLLAFAFREPQRPAGEPRRNPLTRESLRLLPATYWQVVAFGAFFMLARSSDAFLLLRGQEGGIGLAWLPLMLVVMNLAYSLTAYPAGKLSDRIGTHGLLTLGLLVLMAGNLMLAAGSHLALVTAGAVLWGVHLGLTQGLLPALVAQTAPAALRGTAFGMFNLASGLGMLGASVMAGALWDAMGPSSSFMASAAAAALAWLVLQRA